MDELRTIREALGELYPNNSITVGPALTALSRLEARAAEMPDTAEIVGQIRNGGLFLSNAAAGALIGQYAYRYSEELRKERDEWKAMAEQFSAVIMKKLKGQ